MKNKVAVLVTHANPRWIRIFAEVVATELNAGSKVEIWDALGASFPKRTTVRTLAWMRKLEAESQVRVVHLAKLPKSRKVSSPQKHLLNSELFTYFKDPNPTGLLLEIMKRKLLATSAKLEKFFENQLSDEEITKLYVANGRGFFQRNLVLSAKKQGREQFLTFLETAMPHNFLGDRYFKSPFPIHDRVSRQQSFLQKTLASDYVEKVSKDWLDPRTSPASGMNSFATNWAAGSAISGTRNVFFSSSTDEYWALGREWHEDSWEDQFEAFDAVMSKLEKQGDYDLLLRMHPNLANKSMNFVKHELSRVDWLQRRHPTLRVVFPLETANSYELLGSAERVFVSMSTIGVEASARGNSVWCTSATSYDRIADVRKLHNLHAVNTDDLTNWDVNDWQAKFFLACQLLEGQSYVFERNRIKRHVVFDLPFGSILFRVAVVGKRLLERPRVLSTLGRRGSRSH